MNINIETAKAILEIIWLKSKHLDQIHTNNCYSKTAYMNKHPMQKQTLELIEKIPQRISC